VVKRKSSVRASRSSRALNNAPVSSSGNGANAYVALGIAVFLVFVLALGFVDKSTGNVITGNDINIDQINQYNINLCNNNRCDATQGETNSNCPSDCRASTSGSSSGSSSSGFFGKLMDQWNEGSLDTSISKYFIFFMLLILIFSILKWGNFPPGVFLQFVLALFIAFFAAGYIVPQDLIGIMQVYSALGLTLTVVLPFIVLMFFSAMMVTGTKSINVGQLMISRFVWFLFAGFLIYRMIVLWSTEGFAVTATLMITIVAFILSLICGIFFKKFSNSMFKMLRLAKIENLKRDKLDKEIVASSKVTSTATKDALED